MKKSDTKQAQLSYNLRPYQEELIQLSELAGIHADPTILKILIEMLNMQVSPDAICIMLKTLRRASRVKSAPVIMQ